MSDHVPQAQTSGGNSTINLTQVIRVMAIIGNVLLAVVGLIGAIRGVPTTLVFLPEIYNYNASWAIFFFSISLILFAILGIMGETGIKVYLDTISIFVRFWTKGLWYLLMGFFAVGIAGAVGIACAFYLWLVSLLMFILFCMTRSS